MNPSIQIVYSLTLPVFVFALLDLVVKIRASVAQGWVVFQVRGVGDGRIRRAICEAFCIAYGLQAAALFRAQMVEPDSHTVLNTVGCVSFAVLAAFYGYCRWFKTIKVFELPGTRG